MKQDLAQLREALLDLTGLLNRPQPDAALIARAGVDLDRALFPLLARIAARGPMPIGELAELSGRDYTTVSRQITKLESLGLVARRAGAEDARVRDVTLTKKGADMTQRLDRARESLLVSLFAKWSARDLADLSRLLRRFTDDALGFVRREASS